MICSNCNKEIREGATYCEECGAPIDEPVVLKEIKMAPVSKPKAKEREDMPPASGAFFDFSGYVKYLGKYPEAIIALVGAFAVYFAPFLTWMWRRLWEEKISASLFELGGKSHELGLSAGILAFMAVLMLITALSMLVLSAGAYIRPLHNIYKNPIVKLAPIVIALVLLVIVLRQESYMLALDSIDAQIESAKAFGGGSNFDGGQGVGPVVYICGMVLYAISAIMDIIKEKR